MHAIWRQVRGPFRVLHCPGHTWERYDVNLAGCLACGAEHRCRTDAVQSTCPLVSLDDGSVCCTVTGYCPPVVRYSKEEYLEVFVPQEAPSAQDCNLYQEVLDITEWFLMGAATRACKQEETLRSLNRFGCNMVKTLKQQKLDAVRRGRAQLACIPEAVAHALHNMRPQRVAAPTKELCCFCAEHISKCLKALKLAPPPHKRVNMVVGLLYLMKKGLVIKDTQWLPRTASLSHCLPHETCLEKIFKLPMKLVCETENEVKLALRQRIRRL